MSSSPTPPSTPAAESLVPAAHAEPVVVAIPATAAEPAAPAPAAAPASERSAGRPAARPAKFPDGPAPDPAGSREEHRIRTFHARRGRVTDAQAGALERHWAEWGVELDGSPLDLAKLFGDPGLPIVLEIGFGMGDATARMAADDPATGILAVDVHTPGQGNLLNLADQYGLTNVRVANGDAIVLLRDMLPPESLSGLRIYFPDPWPKAKHHKRRMIQPEFLALVAPLLRPGATLHCATDWEPYAEQMLEVLSGSPDFTNQYGDGYAPRPDFRPMTKFERQGLAKDHIVHDLLFTRR
ncbi:MULTISPECIES: tRNA (guanosine(46)-N7)-methyltransferase TrmB [Streptomyces]|uniref:tRNA (guanosine(46)-N7)-methyltransferase TrmB n=1 Tax=Streptomyces TaxID=1883 RepID=UPI001FD50FC8|nr:MULTISPECIES: tRNA (guanosine(46)-N7)-methyltransferase TrmB [Streptomyces]MCZ4096014.1 tRNA (guanosine(46)-N7)-methyltransferase TrmB [Streptomyces sp. H39-C1]